MIYPFRCWRLINKHRLISLTGCPRLSAWFALVLHPITLKQRSIITTFIIIIITIWIWSLSDYRLFGESNSIELTLPENLQQIVINQFSRVAQHEQCSFLGNVTLGSSISLSELRKLYHVVKFWFYICYIMAMCLCSWYLSFAPSFSIIMLCIWAGCPCIWCWKWQKSWYPRRSMSGFIFLLSVNWVYTLLEFYAFGWNFLWFKCLLIVHLSCDGYALADNLNLLFNALLFFFSEFERDIFS